MADSSSYWSDWANNITTVTKQPSTPSFSERFAPVANMPPAEEGLENYNNRNLPMWKRVGLEAPPPNEPPPISGPQRVASQQPTIPIQTAQGAPQSPTNQMQTAPNSGVVGQSPYSNQALTGGGGMPIGGLPTQSPMQDYNSPQQVNPQQMQQPPISGPASPQFRMQNHQQNMQNFAKLLASLRGYNFLNQYLGQS